MLQKLSFCVKFDCSTSVCVCVCVCVYVCNPVLKAQTVYSAFIPFFSLFSGIGQNWVKSLLFFKITCISFT